MRYPRPAHEIRAFGGAGLFRGKDVLDIGTGDGRLAFAVARYARRVVGIDPDEAAVRLARQRADRIGARNVEFRVGSADRLDLEHERFDLAIFSWSL